MKKILWIVLLALTACAGQPKDYYEIFGKVENVEDSTVIMLFRRMGKMGKGIAKDTIIGGKFYFKIKPDSLVKDALSLGCYQNSEFPSKGLELWASAGDRIKVEGKNTLIYTWDVKAQAPENAVLRAYINDSRQLWDEFQQILISQNKLRQHRRKAKLEEIKTLKQQYDSLEQLSHLIIGKINENEIRRMKQTKVDEIWMSKLQTLATSSKYTLNFPASRKEAIIALYNSLTEEQKQHQLAQEACALLFPPQHVKVGEEMKDADLYDLQGGLHHLSELKGKYILIDFWSRGCGPCINAIPELKELVTLFPNRLNVVSISLDTKEVWQEATNRYDMTGNNWNDLKGEAGIYSQYRQGGIPDYTLISPEGIVLEQWMGYGKGSLKAKLAEYLK
ncbi:MAG: AhpC/TSA family protein [Mediterranea massiliensis]|nr:AhpC/TSA family protein [Mediterranea massiliensis]